MGGECSMHEKFEQFLGKLEEKRKYERQNPLRGNFNTEILMCSEAGR